jgi:heterodisulfide reductase subunit B
MKLSYYPGCSLEGTAADYDRSLRQVCRLLDIELVEIDDWNCCGASSAHMTNHEVGMRLPIRNLLLALRAGHDILVPCAACFQRLKAADKALRADDAYWDVAGYRPVFEIVHISTWLSRADLLAKAAARLIRPLAGLTLACYYGCLSLRHPHVTDAPDWEQPRTLEHIVENLGARTVAWSHRTECCSGSLTMARPDIAEHLVADIVSAARRAGAEALVTDCPMCQANVETRQKKEPTAAGLPVFFVSELMEAALTGVYPSRQQRTHLVAPQPLTALFTTAPTRKEASL